MTSTRQSASGGIKGAFAAVHGAGEAIRGTINGAVDDTFNAVSLFLRGEFIDLFR